MQKLANYRIFYALLIGMLLTSINYGTSNAQMNINKPVAAPSAPDTGNGVIAGLSTGSVNHSIPIVVPPGTNGLAPLITLDYSSQAGDSDLLGFGWSLSQSYIEWDLQLHASGASRYRLYLNGVSHDLVNINGNVWGTEIYNPLRIEKLAINNEKGGYWLVTDADGKQYRFGYNTNESELKCSNRDYITRYYLDEVKDVHGNRITYQYQENPYTGDQGATYPTSIIYNNDETRKIEFVYEIANRPDYRMQVRQNCLTTYMRRLSKIVTKVNDQSVREYRLSYDMLGYMGILSSVTEYGSDGSAQAPWRFDYYAPGTAFHNADPNQPWWNGGPSDDDINSRQADVDGDNLPDLIRQEGDNRDTYYYLNEGDDATNGGNPLHGWNTNRQKWYTLGGEINRRVFFVDMTGDMKANFVRAYDRGSYTEWEVYTAADNNSNPIRRYGTTGIDLEDDHVFILDVTGDGKADLVHNDPGENHSWKVCTHGGDVWFESCSHWMDGNPNQPVKFDSAFHIIDVNSDGLPELVYDRDSHDGKLDIHWNTGSSWLSQPEFWPSPFTGNHEKIRFADFNGDNIIDIAHVDHKDFEVYYGNGRGWPYVPHTDPNLVVWSSSIDHWPRQHILDMNGDGLVDVLLFDHHVNKWYVYRNNGYNPASGSAPLRLKSVTNPYGGKTEIEYVASSINRGSKLPGSRWLLSKLTTYGMPSFSNDERAVTIATSYAYEGGTYEYSVREFWGFQKVTQTHAENSTTTYFYVDNIRKFHPSRVEVKDATGNLLYVEEQSWSADTLIPNQQYRTNLVQVDRYEHDGQANNPRHARITYEYDQYNNVQRESRYGEVVVSGDEQFIYTTYIYNIDTNIINRPELVVIRGSNDQIELNRTRVYYDGNTISSTPPTRGLATKVEKWLDVNNLYLAESMTYDAYGNLASTTDALGRTTTYSYDDTYTFVSEVTNPLHQSMSYVYDVRTGQLVSETDPNAFTTLYEYDSFGRLVKEILPYDSSSLPTKQYIYDLDGVAPEQVTIKVRLQSGESTTADVITAFDGFGRTLQVRHPSESEQQIVTDMTYDHHGRIKTRSNPYFSPPNTTYTDPLGGIPDILMQYDALDRLTRQTNPDGTSKFFSYLRGRTEEINENGHRHVVVANILGQITDVYQYIDGQELRTQYQYDGRGSLIQITDALGNVTSFNFDSLGRKTHEVDLDRGIKAYGYDAVGNLKEIRDDNGDIIVTNTYDELNRVITVDYSGSDSGATMVYDREMIGTLSETASAQVIRKSFYDNRLRKIREVVTIRGRTFIQEVSLDSLGNTRSITYPDATTVTRQYTSGILTAVDGYSSGISYSPFRQPTSINLINGLQATWQFDTQTGRVTQYIVSDQQFSYSYDSVGNVASITDSDGYTFVYNYDELDRLISAQETQSALYNIAYTYDAIDRIVTFAHNAGTANYNYDVTQPHAVDIISGTLIPHITSPAIEPIPSQEGELVESWEGGLGNWPYTNGGAASVEYVPDHLSDGIHSVKLNFNGSWSHFQYNFPQTLNLAEWNNLQMHIVNVGEAMNVKIALSTGDSWAWNISPLQPLPHGAHLVEFDLTTNNWDREGILGSLISPDQVKAIVVIVEGDNYPGSIYLDNLRKIGQLDTPTPIPSPEGELVESWEDGLGTWPYTNGGATTIESAQDYASNGTQSVKLSFSDSWSHFQYNFPQTVNLDDWGSLQIDVVNTGEPMNVKFVLSTGDSWAWNTSPLQPLPHGNHLLEFDLTANTWDREGVIGPLTNPDQVKAIVIIVEGDNYPGSIYLDDLRRIRNQTSIEEPLYQESFESGTSHWGFDSAGSDATGISQVTDHVTDGGHAAKLLCNAPGWWSYWYHALPQPLDLSGATMVTLDATAVNAANIKFIIVTSGWEWYETAPQEVNGNTLTYDLSGIDQTKRQNVLTLGLGIDAHGQQCDLYVDNIQVLDAETEGASVQSDSQPAENQIFLPSISQ